MATAIRSGTSLMSILSDLVNVAMSQKSLDMSTSAKVLDKTQNSRSFASRKERHCKEGKYRMLVKSIPDLTSKKISTLVLRLCAVCLYTYIIRLYLAETIMKLLTEPLLQVCNLLKRNIFWGCLFFCHLRTVSVKSFMIHDSFR